MADVSAEIMERNKLEGEDVDWLVPHQANLRIIDATANRMGLTRDKVMINIEKYGNTTAATIPLCLWEWESKLKKGDQIVLAAFGGGFTDLWESVWPAQTHDCVTNKNVGCLPLAVKLTMGIGLSEDETLEQTQEMNLTVRPLNTELFK